MSEFFESIEIDTGEVRAEVTITASEDAFRRVVACVNACAGMETKQMEFFGKGYASTLEVLVGNLREENVQLRRENARLQDIIKDWEGVGEIATKQKTKIKHLKEHIDALQKALADAIQALTPNP
jgi:regulator of replication initiation timing